MNVYQYIRSFADSADISVTEGDVARIAGVLRTADLRGELSEREMELARPIIATRIGRVSGAMPRVAEAKKKEESKDKLIASSEDKTTFDKIDAMVQQGKCARCGQPTKKVALYNYEEARYCEGCRTTLW